LTPDELDDSKKLLAETRADLLKRQLSNAENYDKSILTLSSAALGFSLAFLKDFVPIESATWSRALYVSWYAFAAAIVVTVLSYVASQHGITHQLERATDYYQRRSEGALRRTLSAILTDCLNYASGGLFIIGVVLTTVFVSLNLERGSSMKTNRAPDSGSNAERGAPIPMPQRIEKGAPIPNMQPIQPSTPAPAPAPAAPQPAAAKTAAPQTAAPQPSTRTVEQK
jgi:hypothetical protein